MTASEPTATHPIPRLRSLDRDPGRVVTPAGKVDYGIWHAARLRLPRAWRSWLATPIRRQALPHPEHALAYWISAITPSYAWRCWKIIRSARCGRSVMASSSPTCGTAGGVLKPQ